MILSLREDAVAVAKGYDGVTAGPDPAAYLNLVGPDETAEMRRAMLTMSGCALAVRGFWRLMGVSHPRLEAPYKPGHAVADVVAIARERGAWVDAKPCQWPLPGDVVLVGGDPATDGGVEHVFTVCEVDPDAGTIHSIDGGQVVAGHQAITGRSRRWEVRKERIWDRATDIATPRVRAVKGWADLSKIGAGP